MYISAPIIESWAPFQILSFSFKNYRPVKRRREDPLISLASFLEGVHAELRVMDEALQFLQPVNFKKVPDYLDKVCILFCSFPLHWTLIACTEEPEENFFYTCEL